MNAILKIARLELNALFFSPIAWLLLAVFTVQSSMTFTEMLTRLLNAKLAGFEGFGAMTATLFATPNVGLIVDVRDNLYLYIPLLTMGLISRELNSGSIKLLLSSPVRIGEIVLGKYLAVMAYCLLLALVLVALMVTSSLAIEAVDYWAVIAAIFGIYLLACAYGAIGLFMSALTPYQVVAAISTLAVLAALAFVGDVGQTIPIVRDVTYWLSLSGRVDVFRDGLVATKHVFYFLAVIAMFLSFTVLKLSAGRKIETRQRRAVKYGGVVLAAVMAGYVTSLPGLVGYFDMTRVKSQSLTQASVDIINRIEGPWTVTTYVNILDRFASFGLPHQRKVDFDRFEEYTRFNPDLKMRYTLYYGPSENEHLYKANPGKSDREIAQRVAEQRGLDFDDILSTEEMTAIIDLEPENYRFSRTVAWGGQDATLRVYNDLRTHPSEQEISAALKRLLVGPAKVAFVTGHGERSAFAKAATDYQVAATDVRVRAAMISHGFDFTDLSLETAVPADVDILFVADPRRAYSQRERQHLDAYIERGGNLVIAGEPGRQQLVNPLLRPLGVELMPGRAFQSHQDFPADVLFAAYAEQADGLGIAPLQRNSHRPLALAGAAGLSPLADGPFEVTPLVISDGDTSWYRQQVGTALAGEVAFDPQVDTKASTLLAAALTRRIDGREQRIVVAGDADFMSNGEMERRDPRTNNEDFVANLFGWLSGGAFPVTIERADFPDKRLLVERAGINGMKVVFYAVFPLMLIASGAILLVRRRRA